MNINYTKSYDNTVKKLKKYSEEKNYLDEILDIIRNSKDFDILLSNPLSKMYGMERLKYELNKYYSLNPSKHGGVIRLIIKQCDNGVEVDLVYLSYDHYKDFNEKKVIYYEKE